MENNKETEILTAEDSNNNNDINILSPLPKYVHSISNEEIINILTNLSRVKNFHCMQCDCGVKIAMIDVAINLLSTKRFSKESMKKEYELKFDTFQKSLKISNEQTIKICDEFLTHYENIYEYLHHIILVIGLTIYSGLQYFEYSKFKDGYYVLMTLRQLPWDTNNPTHYDIIFILHSASFFKDFLILSDLINVGSNIPNSDAKKILRLISLEHMNEKYIEVVKCITNEYENLSDEKTIELFITSLNLIQKIYNKSNSNTNGIEKMDITPTEGGITEPEAIMPPQKYTYVPKSSSKKLKLVTQEHHLTDECDRSFPLQDGLTTTQQINPIKTAEDTELNSLNENNLNLLASVAVATSLDEPQTDHVTSTSKYDVIIISDDDDDDQPENNENDICLGAVRHELLKTKNPAVKVDTTDSSTTSTSEVNALQSSNENFKNLLATVAMEISLGEPPQSDDVTNTSTNNTMASDGDDKPENNENDICLGAVRHELLKTKNPSEKVDITDSSSTNTSDVSALKSFYENFQNVLGPIPLETSLDEPQTDHVTSTSKYDVIIISDDDDETPQNPENNEIFRTLNQQLFKSLNDSNNVNYTDSSSTNISETTAFILSNENSQNSLFTVPLETSLHDSPQTDHVTSNSNEIIIISSDDDDDDDTPENPENNEIFGTLLKKTRSDTETIDLTDSSSTNISETTAFILSNENSQNSLVTVPLETSLHEPPQTDHVTNTLIEVITIGFDDDDDDTSENSENNGIFETLLKKTRSDTETIDLTDSSSTNISETTAFILSNENSQNSLVTVPLETSLHEPPQTDHVTNTLIEVITIGFDDDDDDTPENSENNGIFETLLKKTRSDTEIIDLTDSS